MNEQDTTTTTTIAENKKKKRQAKEAPPPQQQESSSLQPQQEEEEIATTPCRLLTLSEWYANAAAGHLLDVRSRRHDRQGEEGFPSSPSSTNSTNNRSKQVVAIPLSEVRARGFELPPRGTPLSLWMDHNDSDNDNATIAALLEPFYDQMSPNHRQYDSTTTAAVASSSKRKRKQLIMWNIQGLVLDTAENNAQAIALGLYNNNRSNDDNNNSPSFVVQPRLWSPDPLVEHVLLPCVVKQNGNHHYMDDKSARRSEHGGDDDSSTTTRLIWDLGAGAGRDACFLAEELLLAATTTTTTTAAWHGNNQSTAIPPYKVVAMDQRYRNNGDDDPCCLFFRRRGLTAAHATCQCIDLQQVDAVMSQLPQHGNNGNERLAGILMVRYWNKALVQALIDEPALLPGTWMAISHFGLPTADATWTFDHPKVCIHAWEGIGCEFAF